MRDSRSPVVGVDARTLVGNRSGVGNYLANVIEAGAFDALSVRAYYDASEGGSPDSVDVPAGTDLAWVGIEPPSTVSSLLGPATPVWWVNRTLDAQLRRDDVDAYFGPNFVQPVGYSGPSCIVVHDLVHRILPAAHSTLHRLYFRAFFRASLLRADEVIAVSENTKRDLRRLYDVPPSKVTVAGGAAADRYRPRSLDGDTRERLRDAYDLPEEFLLYVGNIEPRKNLATLLEALGRFEDDERPALVVVGQRHLADDAFERAYRNCEFKRQVRFTGYVPEADLPLLYNLATVFVYPSLYEGFGLPVLEAMQSGVPVVTADRSSLPEVVGTAGETVDPEDPAAVAAGIRRLWSDPEARARARERGIDRATRFSWAGTAATISSTLDSLVR